MISGTGEIHNVFRNHDLYDKFLASTYSKYGTHRYKTGRTVHEGPQQTLNTGMNGSCHGRYGVVKTRVSGAMDSSANIDSFSGNTKRCPCDQNIQGRVRSKWTVNITYTSRVVSPTA